MDMLTFYGQWNNSHAPLDEGGLYIPALGKPLAVDCEIDR